MTIEQKIIRAKVGLLELARQLGNVSQACEMMGYSRDNVKMLIGSNADQVDLSVRSETS